MDKVGQQLAELDMLLYKDFSSHSIVNYKIQIVKEEAEVVMSYFKWMMVCLDMNKVVMSYFQLFYTIDIITFPTEILLYFCNYFYLNEIINCFS